jgi:anti-sigma factor RsiW
MDELDARQEEQFELLSAYLDNEVTVAERKQVEAWLATDPEFQQLYNQMLKLQRSLNHLPVPAQVHQPVEQTVQQVMKRLERRPQHLMLVWTGIGAAAAAAFVGVFAGIVPGNAPVPHLAQTAPANIQPLPPRYVPESDATEVAAPMLLLSLDKPPVNIKPANVLGTPIGENKPESSAP